MSRDSDYKALEEPRSKAIGFFTSFVFTINVVVGSGILSIPYAFKISGLLVGSIYTVIACSLS